MIELPGTFVDMPLNEMGKCAKFYYDRHHCLCVILLDAKKKTWTIAHGTPYNHASIEGYNNGYNLTARLVSYSLYKLGLWTEDEAGAFRAQQYETDKKAMIDIKIRDARSLLESEGYKVHRK